VKKREKKQGVARDKEKRETVRPQEVKNLDEEEESTTKDVQHIMNQVRRACKERDRIGYFHFLVDPNSFAKTVENMFHFAFLVKDGRVGVALGSDELPYIFLRKNTGSSFPADTALLCVQLTTDYWTQASRPGQPRTSSSLH